MRLCSHHFFIPISIPIALEELKRSEYNYVGATVIDHKNQLCIQPEKKVMSSEDSLLDGRGKMKTASAEIIFILFDVSSVSYWFVEFFNTIFIYFHWLWFHFVNSYWSILLYVVPPWKMSIWASQLSFWMIVLALWTCAKVARQSRFHLIYSVLLKKQNL